MRRSTLRLLLFGCRMFLAAMGERGLRRERDQHDESGGEQCLERRDHAGLLARNAMTPAPSATITQVTSGPAGRSLATDRARPAA